MTETGWKFGLACTAEPTACRPGLPWLRAGLSHWCLSVLALSLSLHVGAQTPTAPSAAAPASADQQSALPSASAPGPGYAVPTTADAALPATPALGNSAQVPSASNAPPAPGSGTWQSLSKRQKLALAPLAADWHELTAQQRQKWLALSRNFFELSDEEQLTLHSRMKEWAALSPRQRSQARFHFNATQSLSAQDKRAQWEAYQALSDQEKHKLSSGPKPPVKSAARSFATPSNRLVSPPLLPVNATRAVQRVAPSKPVHPKTLLPQPS
jgi:hypothetical protein